MKRALQKLIILSFFLLINSNYCWAIEQDSYTPAAIISIQKGETESVVPFSINLDGQNSKDPQNFPLKFKWEFPNNKTSTSKNPKSYKFKNPGNYKIKLTVTNPLNLHHKKPYDIINKTYSYS